MPVQHVVMVKFKEGTTKEQVDTLYNNLLKLEERPMIQSITAGENFDGGGSGWSFTYVITISNLKAYKQDKAHSIVVETFLKPIAAEITSTDFEYPRATAEHGAFLNIDQHDVAPPSPSVMRWSSRYSHPDIVIDHGTFARPREPFHGERFVVGSHPIPRRFYFDVTIERNQRPKDHGLCVGIIAQTDVEHIKELGQHFKTLEGAFGYESHGGFVGGGHKAAKEVTIPEKEWPYDTKIGVFVDQDKGVIQFFFNRKKIGPTLHEDLKDHKYFPAVCLTQSSEVSIEFNASCPPVWIQ